MEERPAQEQRVGECWCKRPEQQGLLEAGEVLSQEYGWSHRGSFHFTDEQLFFFPFPCPLLAWEAPPYPCPRHSPCGPSCDRFCQPQ